MAARRRFGCRQSAVGSRQSPVASCQLVAEGTKLKLAGPDRPLACQQAQSQPLAERSRRPFGLIRPRSKLALRASFAGIHFARVAPTSEHPVRASCAGIKPSGLAASGGGGQPLEHKSLGAQEVEVGAIWSRAQSARSARNGAQADWPPRQYVNESNERALDFCLSLSLSQRVPTRSKTLREEH